MDLEVSDVSEFEGMSTTVQFMYDMDTVTVDAVVPSHTDVRGGSTVNVVGSGFRPGLRCRFGSKGNAGIEAKLHGGGGANGPF